MTGKAASPAHSLALPEHFDYDWTISFLATRVVPTLEWVAHGEYGRTVRVDGAPVTIAIREAAGAAHPSLSICSAPALSPAVLRRVVAHLFALDIPLDDFLRLAAGDALLGPLVRRHPSLRLPQIAEPFEGIVRAVLGQQVSVAAAGTMTDRIVRTAGEAAPALDGRTLLAFPTPAALAGVTPDALLALGLTRAKAATLLAVASATRDGQLDWPRLAAMSETDAQAAMTAVRGIGPWTASYVRMRALGDRDAFPSTDLGVVKAMRMFGVAASEIAARAERWRPWRAYAAIHLWHALHAADATVSPRRSRE